MVQGIFERCKENFLSVGYCIIEVLVENITSIYSIKWPAYRAARARDGIVDVCDEVGDIEANIVTERDDDVKLDRLRSRVGVVDWNYVASIGKPTKGRSGLNIDAV